MMSQSIVGTVISTLMNVSVKTGAMSGTQKLNVEKMKEGTGHEEPAQAL